MLESELLQANSFTARGTGAASGHLRSVAWICLLERLFRTVVAALVARCALSSERSVYSPVNQ